jgi:hypothetical protein
VATYYADEGQWSLYTEPTTGLDYVALPCGQLMLADYAAVPQDVALTLYNLTLTEVAA